MDHIQQASEETGMVSAHTLRPKTRLSSLGWLSRRCLALLAPVALIIWVQIESRRGWSAERLEALIKAEVPAKAERQTVEAWFRLHDINYWYVAHTTGDGEGEQTVAMKAGLRDEDLSGMVRGEIEGDQANVGFMDNGVINVYFFLDKQGRVAGYFVDPFIYSL